MSFYPYAGQHLVRLLVVPVRPRNLPIAAALAMPQAGDDQHPTQTTSGDLAEKNSEPNAHPKRKADDEDLAGSSEPGKKAKTQDHSEHSDHSDHSNHSDLISTSTGRSGATFLTLPCELHLLIFDSIEDVEGIVCLGATSRYFWAIGRERMHDYYASQLGRWAGKNIVCVGESVKADDYPPRLFSEQELEEFRQQTTVFFDASQEPNEREEPFNLYHLCIRGLTVVERDLPLTGIHDESQALIQRLDARDDVANDAGYSSIRSELAVKEEDYCPQDRPWILRNLTTKQFVRADAIALEPHWIHGPHIEQLGFGDVVLRHIFWTAQAEEPDEQGQDPDEQDQDLDAEDQDSDDEDQDPNEERPATVFRREWAGHRFDITTVERHQEETNAAEWSDISDQAVEEPRQNWVAQHQRAHMLGNLMRTREELAANPAQHPFLGQEALVEHMIRRFERFLPGFPLIQWPPVR